MIKQSYKFRIYPNKDQEIQLRKTIGCCRYIYNWGLELRSESYKRNKTRIGFSETSRAMTILKKDSETKWLNDVSAVALQQSLRNLNWSFENFFQKRSDHPKFKKRKTGGSVRFVGEGFSVRGDEFKANRVKKPIKVIWSRELPSKPSSCTISQNPSGQWFVSFVCESEAKAYPKTNNRIGIDLGIETFATLSDGSKIKHPKSIRNLRKTLVKAQKRQDKKIFGSKNRTKAQLKFAKIHQKIVNIRTDFLQKLSTSIVRENQVIAIEDLTIKEMKKRGGKAISRLINEQGWYSFAQMLEYKSDWYGRELVFIDKYFPSSKTCSCCGTQTELTLKDRVWSCACGATHDRDVNAAKNILAVGTTVAACGANVRLSRKQSALKQEFLLEMAG